MTFYNRVQISGTSVGGEVWSCGLNYNALPGLSSFADLGGWAAGIGAFIAGAPTSGIWAIISNLLAVTEVRTEYRGPADELVQAAEFQLATPKVGAGTAAKTLQTSVCFSLLTGIPGRSYRGRVYWPALAYTPSATTTRFTTGDLDAWLLTLKQLNNGIKVAQNTVNPLGFVELGVRSRLLSATTVVSTLAAGDVPDTQRRRRDSLVETYRTLAV